MTALKVKKKNKSTKKKNDSEHRVSRKDTGTSEPEYIREAHSGVPGHPCH